jgi:hypothetical protein
VIYSGLPINSLYVSLISPIHATCLVHLILSIVSSSFSLSLSLFPFPPNLEHRATVKRLISLQFLNPKRVCRTSWTGDQPVARPLPKQTQNKHTKISMPGVGFETRIPAFERAKTVVLIVTAKLLSSLLCSNFHATLSSSLLDPNLLRSTLSSRTLYVFSRFRGACYRRGMDW